MDEPSLLGARNDPRADSRLLCDRVEKFAAVLGFANRAGRHGNDAIDAVGFSQAAKFRQDLERGVHDLGRERAPVQPAGAEAHHFLLAIDDFERQIRPHAHDDHVQRVGADVDGGDAHYLGSGSKIA